VAKGVKASHDALADLFGRIEDFFKRFKVYIESSPTIELLEVLVKVVVEVLSILSIATKEMEQSLASAFFLSDSTLDFSHVLFRKISEKASRKNRHRGRTKEVG
jgi:hypothetical protein